MPFKENLNISAVRTAALALGLAVFLPVSSAAAQSQRPDDLIPSGWHVFPTSDFQNLDAKTGGCFNHSQNEWRVTNDGGGVAITKIEQRKRTGLANPDLPSFPPLLKHEEGMPGRAATDGLKIAMRFEKGWLLGYDAGEFGGGLWLTNEDGSKAAHILSDNIRAIVSMDGGILVLTGLAHMDMDYGNAFFFSNPEGLTISLQRTVHLDGQPGPYTKEPDGSVLFVTTVGLSRITKSRELQRLALLPEWISFQGPNSMAIASDGSVFVGMRMGVMKLQNDSGKYNEEWLLPNECKAFFLAQSDCTCTP